MAKRSAALLVYRLDAERGLLVLIAHMGGPFWARKNERAWSIPKGEYEDGEEPRDAAFREFAEEMGSQPPAGEIVEMGEFRQPSGKVITTYAVEGEFELSGFHSNTFEMEWPKGSGTIQAFPEVDRADWVTPDRAGVLLVKGQVPIVQRLRDTLAERGAAVDGASEAAS
ncbi:NUDIX domain-containing protein [Streptomyces sp. V4-01]|uniref:NUDIX domain-containing protein n=1 Tax=Actinacidiphila polyblastidii TaxID=3110430 RepID=A0ABU7PM66_9ACTN|nr:NUDIX domain-containing protein [Streptomyces sp. V4-01]